MFFRRFSLTLLAAAFLGLAGCRADCWRRPCGPTGPTYTPAPLVPQASAPQPSPLPPRFNPAPPPAPAPSVQGSYSIPIPPDPGWRASTDPGVRLSPPEPVGPEKPRESVRLPQVQTPEPPVASLPSPPRMPMAKDTEGTPPLPVDIPQFAQAKPRVAAGQQPFPDGVSWLQANGYKAVLHVHKPGEDEAAARRQFEKKGLKYLSLEVAPASLNGDVVDQFNRIVADEANLSLFVYDRDSALAGGLWYLHFRLVDRMADDKARAEAGRLGFKEDRDDQHRTMWIAVQNFLKTAGGY